MIILFGSNGYVGYGISEALKSNNLEYKGYNSKDINVYDYSDLEKIIKLKPTLIINAIGKQSALECDIYRNEAHKVFVDSVNNIVMLCQQHSIPLLHISTSSVFDGEKAFCTEYDHPDPKTRYGMLKYASELIIQSQLDKYYIIRIPLIYGDNIGSRECIIMKLLKKVENKEKMKITIDKYESPSWNRDIGKQIISIVKKYPYGIYHVTNSGSTNYLNLMQVMCKIKNIELNMDDITLINQQEIRPNNPLKSVLISEKLPPIRSWEKALEEYLNEI
jgi:dTDP-4-dehydrorhamnose reductase